MTKLKQHQIEDFISESTQTELNKKVGKSGDNFDGPFGPGIKNKTVSFDAVEWFNLGFTDGNMWIGAFLTGNEANSRYEHTHPTVGGTLFKFMSKGWEFLTAENTGGEGTPASFLFLFQLRKDIFRYKGYDIFHAGNLANTAIEWNISPKVPTAVNSTDVVNLGQVQELISGIPPLDGTYADLPALIADQNSQEKDYFYEITDGSGFTGITSGKVWVYLEVDPANATGTEADYTIFSKEEKEPQPQSLSGTTIVLHPRGNNYNYASPSVAANYALDLTTPPKINDFARCFISENATSQPAISGATYLPNAGTPWVQGSAFEMVVESPDGVNVEYYFISR